VSSCISPAYHIRAGAESGRAGAASGRAAAGSS